jgi:hypothetical protein
LRKNLGGNPSDYNIGIRYIDGTVWLEGSVRTPDQAAQAAKLALGFPGVSRVVNELGVTNPGGAPSTSAQTFGAKLAALNPLRRADDTAAKDASHAQPLATSFSTSGAVSTAAVQPVVPPAPAPPVPMGRPAPLPQGVAETVTGVPGPPLPMAAPGGAAGPAPVRYDQPAMPNYSWPSYAAYPNYAAVTYPRQYSATAWPYIGPFYPYPQVPLGWRKVSLEWDDGWWFLNFKDGPRCCWWR